MLTGGGEHTPEHDVARHDGADAVEERAYASLLPHAESRLLERVVVVAPRAVFHGI